MNVASGRQEPAGLRVALVLGTATGGLGMHVASLARGLAQQGFAVRVYGPAATEELFGFTAAGAAFRALEIPPAIGAADVGAVARLRRELKADPVDVVHAHGLRAGLTAALARPSSVPLVTTWHNTVLGDGLRARLLRTGERAVARSADVTLAASDDLVARVVELGGRDVRLGAVAAPPRPRSDRTGAETRRELGAGDRPLVLSVGRLHSQKGYHVLVEAASRWRALNPVPMVVIVGTGPAYRDLAAQISAGRAPVTLLGHRADVPDLLAAADLAVVSSVWEARQLFVQEALSAGVPLVTTAVGGIPGLVGEAAVLVPPNDVDALDEAVRAMLADPQRRAYYAARGRAHAATWPTEQDTIAQVISVYREVVAGARQDPAGREGAGDDQPPSGRVQASPPPKHAGPAVWSPGDGNSG